MLYFSYTAKLFPGLWKLNTFMTVDSERTNRDMSAVPYVYKSRKMAQIWFRWLSSSCCLFNVSIWWRCVDKAALTIMTMMITEDNHYGGGDYYNWITKYYHWYANNSPCPDLKALRDFCLNGFVSSKRKMLFQKHQQERGCWRQRQKRSFMNCSTLSGVKYQWSNWSSTWIGERIVSVTVYVQKAFM